MIQFYINERGEKQYLLTRPSYHVQKKETDGDVNACKKWHLPLLFFLNSFLHYSHCDIVYNQ